MAEITQKEAAAILGVTTERVRQFVIAERLKPVRIAKGARPLFEAADVEALRASRATTPHAAVIPRAESVVALRAFDLFAEGRTLRDVMAALDLPPQKVRALHKEWATPLGGSTPKAAPAVPTFAELAEASARDADVQVSEFERAQAARRAKHERDHAERMRELEELRVVTKKGTR